MWFTVLGTLQVRAHRSDQEPIALGPPANRRLLAVLAANPGKAVRISTLVDALWPDGPPEHAVKTVQVYVYRLRRALGADRIVRDGGGYTLIVGPNEMDALAFEELVRSADSARTEGDTERSMARYEQALDLWGGEPFAEFPQLVAVAGQARRLSELGAGVLHRRAELRLDRDDPATVVPELSGLVATHPYHDGLRGLLMSALFRSGRRAEALEQYRQAHALFVEELGVEPGDGLRQLHQRILRDDPTLERRVSTEDTGGAEQRAPATMPGVDEDPVPAQLPPLLRSFSGRVSELAALIETDAPVVVVDGMPGVGKTALAGQAAHALVEQFPDGQLFVDLHGFAEGMAPDDPSAVLERMLAAIGVRSERVPPGLDDRAALWRAEVARRRLLVVLDNAGSEAQVRPLLPGPGSCRALVTSRRRMPGLDDAQPLSLSTLPEHDAIRLFVTAAGTAAGGGSSEELTRIVRLCGLLPLAVRLAAARLRSRPGWRLSDLLRGLSQEHSGASHLDTGERSVRGAFELSYRQLDPARRRLFRLLGLHPGGDSDAYAAAALTGWGYAEAQRGLEDLVDQHLLQTPAYGRYSFHDLLRSYAIEKARSEEDADGRDRARQRLYDYYLAAAGSAMEVYAPAEKHRWDTPPAVATAIPRPADRVEATAWLDAERANILALAGEQLPGTERHVTGFSMCLMRYFETGVHYVDARELHERALAAARAMGSVRREARAMNNLGGTFVVPGLHTEAESCFRRAVELGLAAEDLESAARSCINVANVLQLAGKLPEALEFATRAVEFFDTRVGDPTGTAAALGQRTLILNLLGRTDEAERTATRALDLARASGLTFEEGSALKTLGSARYAAGRFAEAFDCHRGAAAAYGRSGPVWMVALATSFAGDALHGMGRSDEALDWQRHALELATNAGNRLILTAPLCGLGEALTTSGHPGEALEHLNAALAISLEVALPYDEARIRRALGVAYHELRRPEEARHQLTEAYRIYRRLGVPAADAVWTTFRAPDQPAPVSDPVRDPVSSTASEPGSDPVRLSGAAGT